MLCYKKKKNVLTVRLSGELDHRAATSIRRELDELITHTEVRRLVLDLSDLEFMDSSGIGLIIGRYKLMSQRRGSVAVCGTNKRIDQIFRMSGLYQLVERLA